MFRALATLAQRDDVSIVFPMHLNPNVRKAADVVLRDVELHPVLKAAIRESDSMITKVNLAPASTMVGRSLRDLELETETGMRVLAVKRRGRWNSGVEGDFVLQADDLLIASGPLEAEEEFLAVASGDQSID